MLTQDGLKRLLTYDPDSGWFVWRLTKGARAIRGSRAGSLDISNGYRYVLIDGRKYLESRLAVLWMTGAFPPIFVDHINRVTSDNRWSNLRPCDRSQNAMNRGLQVNNTSGFKGVSWCRRTGKWQVKITSRGKIRWLGRYANKEEAGAVYARAERKEFGEFSSGE